MVGIPPGLTTEEIGICSNADTCFHTFLLVFVQQSVFIEDMTNKLNLFKVRHPARKR
jgi:hypothetical protein